MRKDVKIGLIVGLFVFAVVAVSFVVFSKGEPESEPVANNEAPPATGSSQAPARPAPPAPAPAVRVPGAAPSAPSTPTVAPPPARPETVRVLPPSDPLPPSVAPAQPDEPASAERPLPAPPPVEREPVLEPELALAPEPGRAQANQGGIHVINPYLPMGEAGSTAQRPTSPGSLAVVPPSSPDRVGGVQVHASGIGGRRTYVVQAGDNGFGDIARKQYGDARHWPLIAQANPGVDSRALRPGQELVLPPLPVSTPSAPTAPGGAVPGASVALPPGAGEYIVKSGDTLWSIAEARYGRGTLFAEIERANPGLKGRTLRVGERIVLPGIASTPTPRASAPAPRTSSGTAGTSQPTASGSSGSTLVRPRFPLPR